MKGIAMIDTPEKLAQYAAVMGVCVIRRIGSVWHIGLPDANRGRGRAYPCSSWREAMAVVK